MDPIIQICVPPILLAIVAAGFGALISICAGAFNRADRADTEAAAEAENQAE